MTENTINAVELLSPSEALNRFVPAEQLGGVWTEQETEQARYGFRVGNICLIADPNMGSEVINEYSLCPIPNTPAWFSGLINIRGNLAPVFDLQILFNSVDDSSKRQHLLILGKGDKAAGILIDKLPKVLRGIDESSELPPMPPVLRNYVQTAFILNDNIWLEIEFEGFFMEIGKQIIR